VSGRLQASGRCTPRIECIDCRTAAPGRERSCSDDVLIPRDCPLQLDRRDGACRHSRDRHAARFRRCGRPRPELRRRRHRHHELRPGPRRGAGGRSPGRRKIVAAGTDGSDFALARYNRDGSLDTSFDGDGKVTTSVGNINLDIVNAIAIQQDGKIVAAGTMGFQDFAVARYNADGSLDTSFDGDGIVTTNFPSAQPFDQAFAVAIQADGKIVAAGETAGCCFTFALARYNTDGTLDTSFGNSGRVTTDFNLFSIDSVSALAVQADGKIVAGGYGSFGLGGNDDFALARYNTDGSLDMSFGSGGRTTTDFGGGTISSVCTSDRANDIVIQPDGKIVAAGVTGFRAFCSTAAVARYNSDGSLDTSFGSGGKVTGSQEEVKGLALQPDGKLVGVGTGYLPGGFCCAFVLGRYLQSGSLDPGFGQGGQVHTPLGSAADVVLQADGKIVAAGATGLAFAFARYLPGTNDTTPPVISVPSALDVNATSPAGTTVTYEASATDDTDPNPALTCTPPSGATFPIGDTTVSCQATDAAGNQATASFPVHVKGAQDQLEDLLRLVDAQQLGRGTSLHDKLIDTLAALGSRETRDACNILNAFLASVNAQVGKSLTTEQAARLNDDVLRIENVIGC
jgi:uncharacterized delta-60 repeat protein